MKDAVWNTSPTKNHKESTEFKYETVTYRVGLHTVID
jgi:hypothetical protein